MTFPTFVSDSDPLRRMIRAQHRGDARVRRRVRAMLAYLDAHPDATRATDPELRLRDDLVGEAARARHRLIP